MKLVLIDSISSFEPAPIPVVCKTEQDAIKYAKRFLKGLKIDHSKIDNDDWVSDVNDRLNGSPFRLIYFDNIDYIA